MSTIGVPPAPSCTYASDTPLRTSLRLTVKAFGSGRSGTAGVWHDGDDRHDVGGGDRPRGARRTGHRDEAVLLVQERVRRRPQHERLPGLPRPARLASGARRAGGGVRAARRRGAAVHGSGPLAVPPKELLLSGHAEGLSDQSV